MPTATRGLKTLLKKSAPGRCGKFKGKMCYRAKDNNRPLRGITKLLSKKLFSRGIFPANAITGDGRGGCWRGLGGGRRRGRAVDAQISRLVNGTERERKGARMLQLTRLAFAAMRENGLAPVVAQRVVTDGDKIGTAVDLICQRGQHELVLVELKCGFAGDRDLAARANGRAQSMAAPCSRARDSNFNRHNAQLAVGLELFSRETETINKLREKGIHTVSGALLYVNNERTSLYELSSYWQKRGSKIATRMRSVRFSE